MFHWHDQGVSIHDKNPVLALAVFFRELKILFPDGSVLYGKAFVFECLAKGALVVGTAQGGLQQDAVSFAGRAYARSLVVQSFVKVKHDLLLIREPDKIASCNF
jgi:hypothetical protein